MFWGSNALPANTVYSIAWGCRAILHGCQLDILHDRQSWDCNPDYVPPLAKEQVIKVMSKVLNTNVLPRVKKALEARYRSGNMEGVMELNCDEDTGRPLTVRANAIASGGYLYLVIYLPVVDFTKRVSTTLRGDEFMVWCRAHKDDLKWSNDWCPLIGEKVHVTFNNINACTVVGYAEEAGFLSLLCVPDKAPDFLFNNPDYDHVSWIMGAEIRKVDKAA